MPKSFISLVVLLAACVAGADRLITTPMGKKVPEKATKIELLSIPSRDTAFGWLGYGLTNSIEIEFYGESFDSDRITPGLNLSYNYISPIVDIAPGISAGILDVADRTRSRRAAYLAITYYFGNLDVFNQDTPTILTAGAWSRDGGGFFFNVSVPLTNEIRLIGEHDGGTLTGGIEFKPFAEGSFKYLFREGSPAVGLSFQKRF